MNIGSISFFIKSTLSLTLGTNKEEIATTILSLALTYIAFPPSPKAAKEQSCLLCFYLMDKTSSKFHAFPYHSGDFGSLPRYKNKNGFYFEYSPDEPQYFLQTAVDNKVYEATKLLDDVPFDISALPFRAYEQIYNSFYRDSRNNPLYVDGVFDPNRFLPNEKGGSDNIAYRLYKRNWE